MSNEPRLATAVLVTTGDAENLRILLVERSATLRFFGGYWAFPGGAFEACDQIGEQLASLSCGVRELIEETALLPDALGLNLDEAQQLLAALPEGGAATTQWQSAIGKVAASGQSTVVCRITTPAHSPIRFATDFIRIHVANATEPTLDARELVNWCYLTPAEAVARWRRGELPIAPPTLLLLEFLAEHGADNFVEPAQAAADAFDRGEFHPARFSPGIFTAPVPTPTLPPATTTNCYIVGTSELYVVDPAAIHAEHQQRLIAKLEALCRDGAQVKGILLTHHHRDHTGAVAALSRHFQAPVHAHELTYPQLPDPDYVRGTALTEGDVIELGTAPDGTPGWRLDVMHTPGHARDHLCFIENRYQAAIVGDMLSTISTIIIDPPEGHMATYLRELERLLARPMTTLYPAHGPAHREGPVLIKHFLAHRRAREQKVREALSAEPQSLEALLPVAYGDVAPAVRGAAMRSLLAGLEKLSEEGLASVTAEGHWQLAA